MPLPNIARPPRIDGLSPSEATDTLTRWLFDVYQAIYSGNYTADEAYARGDEAYELATTANDRTKNWESGIVTVEDASATATVDLSEAKSDTNYTVFLTPVSYTGTPAAGSRTIKGQTYATDSFDIELEAAPGSGNSVTFNWLLVR